VVAVALLDKLSATNILSIIMPDDFGKHDLATGYQQWHVSLWDLMKVLHENENIVVRIVDVRNFTFFKAFLSIFLSTFMKYWLK